MNTEQVRTRAIRVLIVLAIALTATPWFASGDGPVIGLADNRGRLAALAAAGGLILHIAEARWAWIGAAFAASVMWREIASHVTVGLVLAAVCATTAAALLVWELIDNIRASATNHDNDGR